MPTLRDVVAVLDSLYDPTWADGWDAVGTVVGDPDEEVRSILFAVDPVGAVVDEAISAGHDLVVTHHPLWLKGVTSVSADSPKGRVVHRLIRAGVGLHTCHTNADCPPLGVSESMALALGLQRIRPLEVDDDPAIDVWTVFVPSVDAARMLASLHAVGAGRVGDYEAAAFRSEGTGQFRPLDGARPSIGSIGALSEVAETRLDLVAPVRLREPVRAALIATHPYEQPAYWVQPAAAEPSDRGSGRIGELAEPLTLAAFAEHVTAALPAHRSATRVAGDLDRMVRTVALCGGSGDFLLGAADAAGADVYVTSDLKHHGVSEHLERPGACAVVDVPHWAAEWTWLPVAAREVAARLGDTVSTHVSTLVTDPWTTSVRPDSRSSR